MTNLLIRVDAGSGIGLGHLQRCLSLAMALHAQGVCCIFLTSSELEAQDRVKNLGFAGCALGDDELGSEGDCQQTLKVAELNECSGIVVDSYEVDAGYLYRLREAGFLVTAIDDLACLSFPVHLVINGAAGAESMVYDSSTGDTQFLLGSKYTLLRKEFWDIPPRKAKDELSNVLLTMGGADGRNLMPFILKTLDSLPEDFGITSIIGPFFNNRDDVEALEKPCRRHITLVHSPNFVRDLMLKADLAISAAGQTLFELAATGTPTIAIQTSENQADNLHSLTQHGVIRPIRFEQRKQLEVDLLVATNDLFEKPEGLMEMSLAGPRLIDGKGACRCAEALASLLTHM